MDCSMAEDISIGLALPKSPSFTNWEKLLPIIRGPSKLPHCFFVWIETSDRLEELSDDNGWPLSWLGGFFAWFYCLLLLCRLNFISSELATLSFLCDISFDRVSLLFCMRLASLTTDYRDPIFYAKLMFKSKDNYIRQNLILHHATVHRYWRPTQALREEGSKEDFSLLQTGLRGKGGIPKILWERCKRARDLWSPPWAQGIHKSLWGKELSLLPSPRSDSLLGDLDQGICQWVTFHLKIASPSMVFSELTIC